MKMADLAMTTQQKTMNSKMIIQCLFQSFFKKSKIFILTIKQQHCSTIVCSRMRCNRRISSTNVSIKKVFDFFTKINLLLHSLIN